MPLWGTYPLPLWLPFQLTFASWRDSPKRNKPNTKPEISQKALSKCIAISLWQTITVKVTVNATVIVGPGAAARKFHMKMWPGNMKMCKAKKHKANKKSGSTHKCARARVCVCDCLWLATTTLLTHLRQLRRCHPPKRERARANKWESEVSTNSACAD